MDRTGLGMRLPGPGFTVRDVADCVGHDHPIDIIDVGAFLLLSFLVQEAFDVPDARCSRPTRNSRLDSWGLERVFSPPLSSSCGAKRHLA